MSNRDDSRDFEDTADQLHDVSVDGIVVIDHDGVVVYANDAACDLLGYERETLIGHPFGTPAATDEPVQIRAVRHDPPRTIELRATETDWRGKPAYIAGLRDITEHKEAVQALRVSESKYRLMLETMPAGWAYHDLIADPEGRLDDLVVLEVNAAFEGITGLVADEMLGRRLSDIAEIGGERELLTGLVEALEAVDIRLRSISRMVDADERVYKLTAFMPDEHHVVTTLDDMTERTEALAERARAEWLMQRSEARFRALFENSLDAIVIADDAGNYVNVNPAACELFGYSREQLLGMSAAELMQPSGDGLAARYQTYVEGGGREQGRVEIVDGNGQHVVAEYSAFPLADKLFVSILRDVTERENLLEQVQHNQRLEALGRLAGGVAHDFNNLLTAIASFGHLVLGELPDGTPAADDVKEILAATDRATSLTDQLLAFSRRSAVEPRVVDLNDVITELEPMIRRLIREDIELVVDSADAPLFVEVDPRAFEQVVINLIVNGRDAIVGAGRMAITTREAHFHDQKTAEGDTPIAPGAYAVVSVTDTGHGMDADVKKHIFEPFYTTKRLGVGTGLGLPTCYGIVKQAGGYIDVETEPGEGTTFHVYLPLTAASEGETETETEVERRPTPDGASVSILVVEDDDQVRRLVGRTLRESGYDVHTAAHGEAALLLLEELGEVQLVVTDVIMPTMSGIALVKRIADRAPETRVLLISGYTDDVLSSEGVDALDVALLSKPFSPSSLLEAVRRVLKSTAHAAGQIVPDRS